MISVGLLEKETFQNRLHECECMLFIVSFSIRSLDKSNDCIDIVLLDS